MGKHLRILRIEDSQLSTSLIIDELRKDGFEVEFKRVDKTQDLKSALESGKWDIVICDYVLPDFKGLDALKIFKESGIDIPFIVVSGKSNKAIAVEIMKAGAHDYVTKKNLWRLVPVVERELGEVEIRRKQRQIEKELRESEERYRTLFEGAGEGILVTDVETKKFKYANPAICVMLGYSEEEIKKLSLSDIHPKESLDHIVSEFGAQSRGEKILSSNLPCLRKDGQIFYVDINTTKVVIDGRECNVGFFRDITERKGMEEMRKSLIHADRLMVIGQLAAGVAHEINNPAAFVMANISNMQKNLGELRGFLKSLSLFFDPEKPEKFLQALEEFEVILSKNNLPKVLDESDDILKESLEGMNRIRSIVKDLRVFSRIEKDELEMVQINELVNVAVNMTYSEIRHKARLEKDLGNIPLIVADRAKIAQVIVNMLLNASQSITKGSIEENKIRIITRSDDKQVVISIEDTGCGIPKEILTRIFDPFFTTKPRDVGTGLGLTLCSSIIQKHYGKIDVRSEVGKGTCFKVKLPIKTDLVPMACELLKFDVISKKRRGKILIIDDEILLLSAYKRGLEPEHSVVTAKSGNEAIEILTADSSFDVVICDIAMPELDGIEVYKILKEKVPKIVDRIIFCSGSAFGSRSKEFRKTVNNIFVDKPIFIQKLKEVVEVVMEKVNG